MNILFVVVVVVIVLWKYSEEFSIFSSTCNSRLEKVVEKKLKHEMKTAMNKVLCVCVWGGWAEYVLRREGDTLMAALPEMPDKTTEAK